MDAVAEVVLITIGTSAATSFVINRITGKVVKENSTEEKPNDYPNTENETRNDD